MKNLLGLLLVFSLQLSGNSILSQEKVTLHLKNACLTECINQIEKQTKLGFLYDGDKLNKVIVNNIEFNDAPIDEVLEKLLHEKNFSYEIMNDVILIKPLITVTGKVTNNEGELIPGVNVMVKGKIEKGTITDANGYYELTVEEGDVLIFSFIGFFKQEQAINGRTVINVVLAETLTLVDEVVITGYQKLPVERSTGSFVRIKQEELDRRPVSSIRQRLEGASAGLSINNNGEIEIRGVNSFRINTRPLFVIDGFPIDGNLSTINPEDIESIDILKDASSASIWGARASNGVIVITTKKGKNKGPLNVNFSSHVAITEKADFSKMKWMNASESIDLTLEYIDKGWFDYNGLISTGENINLINEAQIYLRGLAPNGDVWSKAQYQAYIADLRTRDSEKQWEKYLYRKAISSTYNLSLSGGSEKNTFYASIVYNDNKAGEIGNSNDRFTFNLKDSYQFNDKLSFNAGINASLARYKHNGVSLGAINREHAWNDLVDENGKTIQYYRLHNKWLSKEREELNGIPYSFNQLDEQRNSDNTSENFDIRSNFGLNYEILKDLTFSSSFQYEKGKSRNDDFESMNLPSHRELVQTLYLGENNYQIPLGSAYKYRRSETYSWSFRNTITLDRNWEKHKLNVFAGTETRKIYFEQFNDRKYGYNKQTLTYTPINVKDFTSSKFKDWRGTRFNDDEYIETFFRSSNSDIREVSFFSNIGYEFNKKYVVNASFRIDQKNLFGSDPDFRYKPLWSVGTAWNIHKENLLNSVEFIDRLRLRATYGLGGNANNQSSPYSEAINRVDTYGNKLFNYFKLRSPANDKLKWEETSVLNIGLDFALFNHKFNGSIEYYSKNSKDLLSTRELDPTNGFSSAIINYASITNKGIEISLDASIIEHKGFNWTVNTNFSYNSNKVSDHEKQLLSVDRLVRRGDLKVGYPLDNIYSYNYAGLDDKGDIRLYNIDGTTKSWQEGVTDPNELIYHGTTRAPYYGGLSNCFKYKGFELCMNLTYKFGHKFHHDYGFLDFRVDRKVNRYWLDRWKKKGDELTTRVPRVPYNGKIPGTDETESKLDVISSATFIQHSQDNVLDAAFVRVRDIIVGYNASNALLQKTFIKKLKVTAQITNPFLWIANERGIDPEIGDFSATANSRMYTFGIKATF